MERDKMKYLVTGGAGFIGSHLVERLLNEDANVTVLESDSGRTAKVKDDGKGNQVIVIDDFSEGKWANLPIDPRLTVYKKSILDPDIGQFFEGVNTVFHLAALTRPQWSIVHPVETNQVNVEGTIKVLLNCRDKKVDKVVFVSSSSIYGDQETFPSDEKAEPHPMCPYALTKLIGEQYCKLFELLYGLKANYIRPFNVYGTRQNPKGVYAGAVPVFVDKISKGEVPHITGNGEQARDFIYIDDVTELMVMAAKSEVYGEAFNAGSGENVSINRLYDMVCKLMNKNIEPVHVPPVIEPGMTLADISKAKKLLGWQPRTSLNRGLKMTIEGTLVK